VQVGGGKTVQLGPHQGSSSPTHELKQVRHHAVLAHGLAVQAIRAHARWGRTLGSPRTSASRSRSWTPPSTLRRRRSRPATRRRECRSRWSAGPRLTLSPVRPLSAS
jgi:hypothetical protein